MAPEITLFVGPTAHGVRMPDLVRGDVAVRPPVRRGDVSRLVGGTAKPGVVAIVDGTFHSYPSVGHAEIGDAVAAGWSVWGLSSMGAIRAAEMRHHGMRGFGAVYQRYAASDDFDDDEVALVHEADPPYRPLSEPLIHIREFIRSLSERAVLNSAEAELIVLSLKNRWFAERTLFLLRDQLIGQAGLSADEVAKLLTRFDDFRLKRVDLVTFLTERPWSLTGSPIMG
jgi:hypothetical protein